MTERPNPGEVRVLFVHVPKTGGVTLIRALEKVVGKDKTIRFARGGKEQKEEYLALPDDKLRAFHFIAGHFSLAFFLRKPISDYKIVTLVREPVDRELSAYYYMKISEKHPDHQLVRSMDLPAYLDYRKNQNNSRNPQCRYISGTDSFEAARKLIDETYFLAAPTEFIQPFYEELTKRLGLERVQLGRENVTQSRLAVHEVHPNIRAGFEAFMEDDLALYGYVKQKFAREIVGGLAAT